ncbi:MAG TPA: zinc-ribbon domain-containing protein [Myxococcota bacterium]|nr:zinc-ribbon domain-containing protein [Myxococcota bacterium]
MIITCERCETEFHLDDARVPQGGARVRCSRCKHAFFVMPPASSRDEAVDRAASRALADDPVPDVAVDLPAAHDEDTTIPDTSEDLPAESRPPSAEEDESDWQFNADLPARSDGDSSPDLHARRGPDPAPAKVDPFSDEANDSLELASDSAAPPARAAVSPSRAPASAAEAEDLGSPVDWDFFDKSDVRAAPAVPALPQRASAPVLNISLDDGTPPARPREIPRMVQIAAAGAGWAATGALLAIALWRGLAPASPPVTAWPDPAPGIAIEQVRGRWLDNAPLGRLYVVSGRVHNVANTPASLPRLVLELRDAAGRAIGAPIPLRGTATPERLREADAAALAAIGSDFPGGLAAGVTWDFEVVAWPLPRDAMRFAIRAGS